MYKVVLIVLILLPFKGVIAQKNKKMEATKIRELIEKCYLNGALNDMNTAAMYEGYHADFAIFYADGNALKKLPLDRWVQLVNDDKKKADNKGLRRFDYEFVQIDVNETAAFVKLKLMREDILVFTDLLTLLKFDNQWKIVTKIYHSHIEKPWE